MSAYKLLERTAVGRRFIGDRRFRVFVFTGASLMWNLVYGVYNGVLGVIYGSAWFGVLCAYYLVLCAMRVSVMPRPTRKGEGKNEVRLMLYNGIVLIVMAFVLSFVVLFSLMYSVRIAHEKIVMIGIAAYTFYIAVLAVVNFVKAHRERSAFLITVRNISLAAATASMMTLERSMLSTFSGDAGYALVVDACVGAGGFLIVLSLGISMLVTGVRRERTAVPH